MVTRRRAGGEEWEGKLGGDGGDEDLWGDVFGVEVAFGLEGSRRAKLEVGRGWNAPLPWLSS